MEEESRWGGSKNRIEVEVGAVKVELEQYGGRDRGCSGSNR